jgi:glycosyltransferase involved in cell wall biosynthesis
MVLVSVIIPSYNGAQYIGEAIQSVLSQRFQGFELIVVDDGSSDSTVDLVKQFSDPRVKCIRHDQNQGAVAARRTGVYSSKGEIIAFLDQDDLFHPEKLNTHVEFLNAQPKIGASYNGRFEIRDSLNTFFGVYHPPKTLTLADFVLGFPIAPSDTVLRREWAMLEGIWDHSFSHHVDHVIFNGQEIVFGGRLALAGCQFENVGRTLNYRRYHSQRRQKHLAARCESELACQEIIFKDQRCPQDVIAIYDIARSNIYLTWAFVAYMQGNFYLGQEFLRNAVERNPSLLNGEPCELIHSWIAWIAMDNTEHSSGTYAIINSIFNNFPEEYNELKGKTYWALARSYLYRGMHCMIWGQNDSARDFIFQAKSRKAIIDDIAVSVFIHKLLDFEAEFGTEYGLKILRNMAESLYSIGYRRGSRFIQSAHSIAHAFKYYQSGDYHRVRSYVLRGIIKDPEIVRNRGVLAIYGKSFLKKKERLY